MGSINKVGSQRGFQVLMEPVLGKNKIDSFGGFGVEKSDGVDSRSKSNTTPD